MKDSFRQSMARLHTWAGILPGWLLFVIFLFGTVSYFQQEISCWMKPENRHGVVTATALQGVTRYLSREAPDAERWRVSLPTERGGEPLSVSWKSSEGSGGTSGNAILDTATGKKIVVRETNGGTFLYRFHYELYFIPWWLGLYLVGIASLSMLITIISGVVTHKKIFADFFLLRFGKAQRSWLDAHNVTAVLALPFHLMITYTGLVTLMFTLMPWAIGAHFPDRATFFEAIKSPSPKMEGRGVFAPLLPLQYFSSHATTIWGDTTPRYINITNPGTTNAVVEVSPHRVRLGWPHTPLYFNGVSGELLSAPNPLKGALAMRSIAAQLHTGLFSGPMLRWLYFLSGLGGTVMIASGVVLWTVKHRAKLSDPARPHFSFRLVERLNIGVIAGAPAGIAAYFLANRLLPLDMTHRADWEINSLFIAWGAVFVWTLSRPARRAWIEALAICAALYALVPVINALTTTRGLVPSLIAQDWVFVGFDGVMLAMAAACAFTAWKVATHKAKAAPLRKARVAVEAAL